MTALTALTCTTAIPDIPLAHADSHPVLHQLMTAGQDQLWGKMKGSPWEDISNIWPSPRLVACWALILHIHADSMLGPTLRCAALHCTELRCTALHCTELNCTELRFTALRLTEV